MVYVWLENIALLDSEQCWLYNSFCLCFTAEMVVLEYHLWATLHICSHICVTIVSSAVFLFLLVLFCRYFPTMAESADMEQLQASFKKFAIHGDTKATGKELNGKNWAKLCKDCKIIDGKNVTSTDVDIVFSKVKLVKMSSYSKTFPLGLLPVLG